MKKKILLGFLLIAIVITCGIIYLNKVFLPDKIKAILISRIEGQTGQPVRIASLKFSIFKGLLINDLRVGKTEDPLLTVKQGSCVILIQPFLKKQIIIPNLHLDSAEIYLKRKADRTFNFSELFTAEKEIPRKEDFHLIVSRISVKNSTVNFRDEGVSPTQLKKVANLDLGVFLSLPARIEFNFRGDLSQAAMARISGAGVYDFRDQAFRGKVNITGLAPDEHAAYYSDSGFGFPSGQADLGVEISFENNLFKCDLDLEARQLSFNKGGLSGKTNSRLLGVISYDPQQDLWDYQGNVQVEEMSISGIEYLGTLSRIKGKVLFDANSLTAERLSADCFGIPCDLGIKLDNFNDPDLRIEAVSNLDLAAAKKILAENFDFNLPFDLRGKGLLMAVIKTRPLSGEPPVINGTLNLISAEVEAQGGKYTLQEINGPVEFSLDQLKWRDLAFIFSGLAYKSSGVLTNFASPGIQVELSSQELSLRSIMAVKDGKIRISSCAGSYLESEFKGEGGIDLNDPEGLVAAINAQANISLQDLKAALPDLRKRLQKINPIGKAHLDLKLEGPINDFKAWQVEAGLTAPRISLYGMNAENFLLDYRQRDGIIDIPLAHFALYGGSLDLNAKMNLLSENPPYLVDANIQGVQIEKLKMDTTAKDKDISGVVRAQAKINGFWKGPASRLTGSGQVFITDGKLWQLNLFQGLGSLLFTSDFNNIVFSEAFCGYTIQDNSIYTNNLKMKSNLADLFGELKIDFDGVLDARLDVQVSDQAPLSGTFRDVTTAILGQARRFGVIKIDGTLAQPKYKFETSVMDIIQGVRDTFLNRQ